MIEVRELVRRDCKNLVTIETLEKCLGEEHRRTAERREGATRTARPPVDTAARNPRLNEHR